MAFSKKHTKTDGFNPNALCGIFVGIGYKPGVTSVADDVTCGNCLRSKKFKPGKNSRIKCVMVDCIETATHVHTVENFASPKYCEEHRCDGCDPI